MKNEKLVLNRPTNFPKPNANFYKSYPTQYGVKLGKKLFREVRLSQNNTVSCATCHIQESAYADHQAKAVGIFGKVGLRNTPPIQNMAFTCGMER